MRDQMPVATLYERPTVYVMSSPICLVPRIAKVNEIAGGRQAIIDFTMTVMGDVKPCIAGQAVYNFYTEVVPLQR